MFRRLMDHFDDMVLALTVWMCSLPLVGLFIVPFWGFKAGFLVATVLLIAMMIICWGICSWKIFGD